MEGSVRALLCLSLASGVWVQLAKSAALSERMPEKRFLFPHRTFTKVYHFKSTTTVVAPAVCYSMPADLTECGPGIQPSTTMTPSSNFKTALSLAHPEKEFEGLINPLEKLHGSSKSPESEELLGPDSDTWGFFGLTIDSTLTRIITDLETVRQVDPEHTATLVVTSCKPSALPMPSCPENGENGVMLSPLMEQLAEIASVSMATEPLSAATVTITTDPPSSTPAGPQAPAEKETEFLAENLGSEAEKMETRAAGEREGGFDEIKAGEIKSGTATMAAPTTMEPSERQEEEKSAEAEVKFEQQRGLQGVESGENEPISTATTENPLPSDFTLRQTLLVQDIDPTQIVLDTLVVRPGTFGPKTLVKLPQLDDQVERVEVQPFVQEELGVISDTVDAVKKLIGVSVKEMGQMEGLQIGGEPGTEKMEI